MLAMLGWRCAGAVGTAGVLVAVFAGVTGCQKSSDPGSGSDSSDRQPSSSSSGYGAVFLAVDECSSRGRATFTEVPCTSERAAARVIARYDDKVAEGPPCPVRTDFVLHITEGRPTRNEVPRGYACMRNLEEPHPGDPGGGGGPRTVVGDCVYSAGRGEVRETACDGSGAKAPEYRVRVAVTERALCPAATQLYVALGGGESGKPVGCAVRV
ncbi:hypothetical protein ACGFSB_01255 [Streptomyces sp. NPDC048441]|uniref:hypothetical protein n=1 Tax=Streptomyces sp. NPDC048441 TaxID=3365552 RepID=UPI0037241EDE